MDPPTAAHGGPWKPSRARTLCGTASWVTGLLVLLWIVLLHLKIELLEAGLVAAAGLIAFLRPGTLSRPFRQIESWTARIANKRAAAVALVTMLALGGRAVLLVRFPVPTPRIHDEFSYLLAGETYASGRLTNPTHPMWTHFETFHVDQRPTYMSMYPPAQGLLLALGQKIGGLPWLGIWLSAGVMYGAICWALQGWFPPRWAFLGGLLAVFRIGLFSYFVNSYRGGTVAAIGGALIIGAVPRLLKARRIRDAVILAIGMVLVANSRPVEGLILGAAAAGAMVVAAWRGNEKRVWLRRVALPLVLVLAGTGAAMAYYNARVFGNPFTLPYQVNRRTYAIAPVFYGQKLAPAPVYRYKVMQDFYLGWEREKYEQAQSWKGVLSLANLKAFITWSFFFGPALTAPLLVFPFILAERRIRFLWIAAGAVGAALALELFFKPHYAAPLTAVIFALIVEACRRLWLWRWRGKPTGRFLVRTALPISIAICLVVSANPALWKPSRYDFTWHYFIPNLMPRDRIIGQLQAMPGRQLVLVKYSADHDPNLEWVYNAADIDRSDIVWARDAGPYGNHDLLDYFHGRKVWLLEPDRPSPLLQPYPGLSILH